MNDDVKLRFETKLRIKILKGVSHLLGIPIKIDNEHLWDYKKAEIENYLAECAKLFGPVFEPKYQGIFEIWAIPHLKENYDDPFNLHQHPVDFVASYFGLGYDQNIPYINEEMDKLYEKYKESGLVWHEQDKTSDHCDQSPHRREEPKNGNRPATDPGQPG